VFRGKHAQLSNFITNITKTVDVLTIYIIMGTQKV